MRPSVLALRWFPSCFTAVCAAMVFRRMSWNATEDAVVYAAEQNPPQVSSLFSRKGNAPGRGEDSDYKHKEVCTSWAGS